jgi:FKBP-type peptidyl-prolyl cis-trans isomerase FkpA
MNPKKYQSMIKRAIPILLIALVFSLPASADEGQAGLQYWKGIDKEAITTSSGLQYKIMVNGNGRKPEAKNRVAVHYRGLLLDGTEFDSSYSSDEPITLSLKRVIKGWTEGIQLMPTGSVFIFLIPPELAYGEKGAGTIPPDSTLIFVVELFGIK